LAKALSHIYPDIGMNESKFFSLSGSPFDD
jgi:hypothetical protein